MARRYTIDYELQARSYRQVVRENGKFVADNEDLAPIVDRLNEQAERIIALKADNKRLWAKLLLAAGVVEAREAADQTATNRLTWYEI